jgi:hypothetical protein
VGLRGARHSLACATCFSMWCRSGCMITWCGLASGSSAALKDQAPMSPTALQHPCCCMWCVCMTCCRMHCSRAAPAPHLTCHLEASPGSPAGCSALPSAVVAARVAARRRHAEACCMVGMCPAPWVPQHQTRMTVGWAASLQVGAAAWYFGYTGVSSVPVFPSCMLCRALSTVQLGLAVTPAHATTCIPSSALIHTAGVILTSHTICSHNTPALCQPHTHPFSSSHHTMVWNCTYRRR